MEVIRGEREWRKDEEGEEGQTHGDVKTLDFGW